MASPVVVDGKNLFAGGEGIVYLRLGKELVFRPLIRNRSLSALG